MTEVVGAAVGKRAVPRAAHEQCPVIHTHHHLPAGTELAAVIAGARTCVHQAIWQIHCSANGQEPHTSIVTTAVTAIDLGECIGAPVLVAQHGADQQCRSFCHVRQLTHPRILALYGAHKSRLHVCQSGVSLREFLMCEPRPTYVLRVLRDVMCGLQFMHECGFAHGSVDEHHMFVGDDLCGKLLAHFCRSTGAAEGMDVDADAADPGVELESETRAATAEDDDWLTDDESVDPDIHNRLIGDEVQFAKCAARVIETIQELPMPRADTPNVQQDFESLERLLHKTLELLTLVQRNTSDERILRSSGAQDAIKRLAELEAGVYGSPSSTN